MAGTLVWATYPAAAVVVVLFGAAAALLTFRRERARGKDTAEFFMTARGSVKTLTIAFSFYAAAMGSWALYSPASYAYLAGILGLAMYAFSAGLPIVVVAFFGTSIQRQYPSVLSMSDFSLKRFGRLVQLWVSALMLLNMGIAMTAEYTAVGDLFEYIIGATRVPITVIIGVVAMGYTAYGGLYVSIITDQWQALVSLLIIAILFIFVAATFRAPLPKPLPDYLSASNKTGLASIGVMPISLISSTVFSEAMWQRCWASASPRSLKVGAILGACGVTVAVFLFGFAGFLAVWSGLWQPAGPDDYGNTLLFSMLDISDGGRHTWVIALVAILAVTMSESAIDSLQNAVVDNISGAFLRDVPLKYLRALVLVLNVPPVVVSLQKYNILQLFLIANLITTTSTLPLLAGLWRGRWARYLVTPATMLAGCWTSLASLFVYCKLNQGDGETYNASLHRTFFEIYDWPPFVIALGFSLAGMALGAAAEFGVRAALRRPHPENPLAVLAGTEGGAGLGVGEAAAKAVPMAPADKQDAAFLVASKV